MTAIDIEALAGRLDDAARHATATPQLEQAISLEQAYAIQRLSIERRLRRGERRIGIKMGFTSRAKMVQMGVSDMIWGRLTSAMLVDDGLHPSAAMYRLWMEQALPVAADLLTDLHAA